MTETTVQGRCLCGAVSYEISGNLGIFHHCCCSRCRKVTGGMHASNLFVAPDQFRWTAGESLVKQFSVPGAKYFMSSFCSQCGSNLPWASSSGKAVIVPAGTLEGDPGIRPKNFMFYQSRAEWHVESTDLPRFDELPPKKA